MGIMYSILNILYTNKAQSKLYALTQKDIEEALIAVVKSGVRGQFTTRLEHW